MCKKVIVEVPVTDREKREQLKLDRMTFAVLVLVLAQGGQASMQEFLSDKSDEDIAEYARIWDQEQSVPVGILFQRPDFEAIKVTNKQKRN